MDIVGIGGLNFSKKLSYEFFLLWPMRIGGIFGGYSFFFVILFRNNPSWST
jgi:hypothetical protein